MAGLLSSLSDDLASQPAPYDRQPHDRGHVTSRRHPRDRCANRGTDASERPRHDRRPPRRRTPRVDVARAPRSRGRSSGPTRGDSGGSLGRSRRPGMDAVWLMGVWERSPAGPRSPANAGLAGRAPARSPGLRGRGRRRLAVLRPRLRRRRPPRRAGGPRRRAPALAGRGLRLILDFVPNHIAPDHPWWREHPEFFVTGDARPTSAATRARSCGPRRRARPRAGPVVPRLARRGAARRVPPGLARRRSTPCGDRRPVRRRALRHGDAGDRRRVRPDLGRPRRRRAGRPSSGRGHRRGAGGTRASSSSPRPTGTWSGASSGWASTSATTRGSTTASSRGDRRGRAPAPRADPTTSGVSCASSRTMTSPARRRCSPSPPPCRRRRA